MSSLVTLDLYVDTQNLYNYKAIGQEILPETDASGNYVKDPNKPDHYITQSYPDTLDGTIIPTIGLIVEF